MTNVKWILELEVTSFTCAINRDRTSASVGAELMTGALACVELATAC